MQFNYVLQIQIKYKLALLECQNGKTATGSINYRRQDTGTRCLQHPMRLRGISPDIVLKLDMQFGAYATILAETNTFCK